MRWSRVAVLLIALHAATAAAFEPFVIKDIRVLRAVCALAREAGAGGWAYPDPGDAGDVYATSRSR